MKVKKIKSFYETTITNTYKEVLEYFYYSFCIIDKKYDYSSLMKFK